MVAGHVVVVEVAEENVAEEEEEGYVENGLVIEGDLGRGYELRVAFPVIDYELRVAFPVIDYFVFPVVTYFVLIKCIYIAIKPISFSFN